ncbi:MAG: formylglycine-generating enzyme family protein [Acidobacteriota bacterium]
MKKRSIKTIALFLSFLILLPEISIPSEKALKTFYKNGVTSYEKGDYEEAVFHLNTGLELVPVEKPVFKAKILLILASCYTKLGNVEKSEQTLSLLKQLIKKKKLEGIPSIYLTDSDQLVVELNPSKLAGYRKVFKDNKYKVKRLIEKEGIQKTSKKNKKKILMITGAVIIAIIAAVMIFKRKKEEPPPEEPYREVEWITIPAGEFEMGDDKNIGDPDERPLHKVYLDEYSISKYEITFEQFDKFCDDTGRERPSPQIYGFNKSLPRGKFPVVNINRNDANAYCDWLSQKLGRNIHLPTEAQWEKAARGTDKRTYPWGDQMPTSTLTNWLPHAPSHKPHIVGSHPEGNSPYGVCDMAGNVWELCNDWYDKNYYNVSPYKNPQGPLSGSWRILRGGSYIQSEGPCRSTYRNGGSPFNLISIKYSSIGFRPVMEH